MASPLVICHQHQQFISPIHQFSSYLRLTSPSLLSSILNYSPIYHTIASINHNPYICPISTITSQQQNRIIRCCSLLLSITLTYNSLLPEPYRVENHPQKGHKQMTTEIETCISLTMQQKQASTYNHPCGDLIDGGTREAYLDIVVPLYRALMEGDLEAAKVILKGQDQEYNLVRYSISTRKETPLHVAVMGHSTEFVRYLVSMMSMIDLQLQNGDGNTAFCLAAISGDVGMAKIMVEKNSELPIIRGNNNMMPLYLAAFHGKHEMATFLYDKSNKMMGDEWINDDRNGVLLKCVQSNIFDVALRIMEDNEELPQDKHEWDVLQVLARTPPGAFQPVRRYRLPQFLAPAYDIAITIMNINNMETDATRLLRLLWKRIMKNSKDVIDEILRGPMIEKDKVETYPSQVVFIAAKMNNTRFLVELIREYHDLIWKTNDDGQTIFHVAVAHRHHDIYKLLYEIGSMKDLITPITDQQGNNILHLVGMKPEKNAYEDRMTYAIQMFDEFSWYKEVKGILPPLYREVKNATGETPQELFTKNHENLVSKGMESINESINISMVVSTLVCAIGFSVVFQIPGGFDQDSGFPMFLHNSYFTGFLVFDVISFLFASYSIVVFLSVILTPKHRDMELLLTRWVNGQLTLLYSVLFLALAFFFSFFILYLNSTLWKCIIYGVAFIITTRYVLVWVPIILEAQTAIIGTKFSPKKHTLYRKKKTESFKCFCYDQF